MGDNVIINPATGMAVASQFASDEIGGVQHQRVKVEIGADGVATDVSSANPMPVSQTIPADIAAALTDGRKTVTTPGTQVAIVSSATPCKWVMITALLTNTQVIFIGGSGVDATIGAEAGTPLAAGDSITVPISNAQLVFVDSRVAGEGISFTVGA